MNKCELVTHKMSDFFSTLSANGDHATFHKIYGIQYLFTKTLFRI